VGNAHIQVDANVVVNSLKQFAFVRLQENVTETYNFVVGRVILVLVMFWCCG